MKQWSMTMRHRQRHHAAAGVPPVEPVADRGELRRAAHDVVDRDLAGEPAVDVDRERHAQRPARASRSRRRTSARNVAGRSAPPGGTVASHGRSQSALARRAACQAWASPCVERPDGDLTVGAGWPATPAPGSMVAPDDLLDGVLEDRAPAPRGRPSPRPASPGRLTTRQLPITPARPRDSAAAGMPFAAPYARIASAMPGTSKSSSARVSSGVRSVGVSPVPPVVSTTRAPSATAAEMAAPDRVAVGYDDRGADREPQRPQEVDEQRPGRVVVHAGRGAVGRDDDRRRDVHDLLGHRTVTGSSRPTCRRSWSRPGRR